MSETIVLIHGLWMTPLSREGWNARFGERGHTVEWAVAQAAKLAVPR